MARGLVVLANLATVTYFMLSFGGHRIRFGPYRLDLDVYRIGGQVWLHGKSLYGPLPATSSGVRLPFSYPPISAVLLSPFSLMSLAVAGVVLTLGGIALTALVLRWFLRTVAGPQAGSWWTIAWLLPIVLLMEPVRNTLNYGQVNILLMALVAADCLAPNVRWPRGAAIGLAAAVKVVPGGFVLFFLCHRNWRAAGTAVASFAAVTAAGFLLDWHDSVRYWTSTVFDTSRPGSLVYAANQSIVGVLGRAGLDPRSTGGTVAWLALAAVVLALAWIGMRHAIARSADAWALSLNAFAGLLLSPVSWSHHWVWAETALLVLAVASYRHRYRAGLVIAAVGFVIFAVGPQWLFPNGSNVEMHWAAWEKIIGSLYVFFALAVLLLSARRTFADRILGTPDKPAGLPADESPEAEPSSLQLTSG
jgi:alpha-1,2-mannosyltransferase